MKTLLSKQAYFLCLVAFVTLSANAQYTETFESQTPFLSSFNSNGQPFTLTNSFTVFSSRAGYGYQHSNRFIDNSNMVATNQTNSIKTANGAKFTVKNFWLYVSTDGGNNPSGNGSLIITGKLGGVAQFTINKTSGFSTSFVPDNGFAYVDLTTEGGVNNSNITIDEIQFQLQGNFNYIAIDNFTWAPQLLLPLSLVSYSVNIEQGNRVKLSWQTAYENNISQFIIKKSSDGRNFTEIGTLAAAGYNNYNNATNYQFIDMTPLPGANYYSLEEEDKDGSIKQLGVKEITLYNKFNLTTLYPNPVTNGSFILNTRLNAGAASNYFLMDVSGRIIQKGNIISAQQRIDVSRLVPGSYTIKLSDGEVIKWIKN